MKVVKGGRSGIRGDRVVIQDGVQGIGNQGNQWRLGEMGGGRKASQVSLVGERVMPEVREPI